jgi:hypothetical protein
MRGSGGLLRRSPDGSAKVSGQNLQSRVSRGVAVQTGRHSSRGKQEQMVSKGRTLNNGQALGIMS